VSGRRRVALDDLVALAAGIVFAAGLAISGMTSPAKVSGFLDVAGRWDPSLALVMLGAVAVYFVAARLAQRRAQPILGGEFLRAGGAVDARLVTGAALFGVGWGLSGFCPGPAIVALGAGARAALWFVPAMVAGMILHRATVETRVDSDG
jgi:uncharacterized membrane protein YedE/YeeE